jgi:hypothetical protein
MEWGNLVELSQGLPDVPTQHSEVCYQSENATDGSRMTELAIKSELNRAGCTVNIS